MLASLECGNGRILVRERRSTDAHQIDFRAIDECLEVFKDMWNGMFFRSSNCTFFNYVTHSVKFNALSSQVTCNVRS